MVLEIKIDSQTINDVVNFEYSINMNEINKSIINIEGNTNFQNNLLSIGSQISILRNNVLEFRGRINSRSNLEGNAVKLLCRGAEEELAKDNIDITILSNNGVYINTDSADIFEELIGNGGVAFSAGTINTGINIDQKVKSSSSWLNGIYNLLSKTGQEASINYITNRFSIFDSLGTNDVDTLNEKTDFKDLVFQDSEPAGKKVIVYGKGDGENQIIATATATGFIRGTHNVIPIRDPTIISQSEAQIRANAELSKLKENIETYTIPIINPNKNYVIGDTITINASSYGIIDKSVRIVRVVRGKQGDKEFLQIEVTNTNHSKTFKNAVQKINSAILKSQDNETYMQGSGNTLTFSGQINGDNTSSLIIPFNLPDSFIRDEANNIRVNSFTLDYDFDKFRQTAGDIVDTGIDADVSGFSSDTQPAVIGETASESLWEKIGSSDSTSFTLSSGTSWDNSVLSSDNFNANNYSLIMVELTFTNTGIGIGSGETIGIRVQIGGSTQIMDYFPDFGFSTYEDAVIMNYMLRSQGGSSVDIDIDMRITQTTTIAAGIDVYGLRASHTHTAGVNLDAENHPHASGSYDVNSNEIVNAIDIGDAVSDAAVVNSTGVSWELQFWNETTWVNKNSGSETFPAGQTFNNVDISSNGTYPDNSGDWRIIILGNSIDADLIKGVVNVKHSLDN